MDFILEFSVTEDNAFCFDCGVALADGGQATLCADCRPPVIDITRELVGQALYKMRQEVAGNDRRTNAVNRAALNLEACPWIWNQDEAELVIISASDPHKRYHVSPMGCDCQAARSYRPCWHGAAYQIICAAYAIGKHRQIVASLQPVAEPIAPTPSRPAFGERAPGWSAQPRFEATEDTGTLFERPAITPAESARRQSAADNLFN